MNTKPQTHTITGKIHFDFLIQIWDESFEQMKYTASFQITEHHVSNDPLSYSGIRSTSDFFVSLLKEILPKDKSVPNKGLYFKRVGDYFEFILYGSFFKEQAMEFIGIFLTAHLIGGVLSEYTSDKCTIQYNDNLIVGTDKASKSLHKKLLKIIENKIVPMWSLSKRKYTKSVEKYIDNFLWNDYIAEFCMQDILKNASSENLIEITHGDQKGSRNYYVDFGYLSDGKNVFYSTSMIYHHYPQISGRREDFLFHIEKADLLSFKPIFGPLAKDKNNVYLHGEILPDANPVEVELVFSSDLVRIAVDNHHLYIDDDWTKGDPNNCFLIQRIYPDLTKIGPKHGKFTKNIVHISKHFSGHELRKFVREKELKIEIDGVEIVLDISDFGIIEHTSFKYLKGLDKSSLKFIYPICFSCNLGLFYGGKQISNNKDDLKHTIIYERSAYEGDLVFLFLEDKIFLNGYETTAIANISSNPSDFEAIEQVLKTKLGVDLKTENKNQKYFQHENYPLLILHRDDLGVYIFYYDPNKSEDSNYGKELKKLIATLEL